MDTNGVTTSANVTAVDGDNVTVLFITEDQRLVTSAFTWWPAERPAAGDRIEITYDPDDPSYVIKAGSNEDHFLATAIGLIALFLLAVAVGGCAAAIFIHRARGKAMRRTGFY